MIDIKYKLSTIEDVQQAVQADLPIMFDTETIGLYGKIRLAQFYQTGWECALLVEWPDAMVLVSLLNNLTVIAHNAHYDISTVQENLGKLKWQPKDFHCTLLLGRLYFYTKQAFSLDEICSYVLGYNPYQGQTKTKKQLQSENWNIPVLSEEQLRYAATDVICLQKVWDLIGTAELLENINYKLDLLTLKYCLKFQNNGLPISRIKLNERYKSNTAAINELALPINCNSFQQVRAYINSTMSDDAGLSILSFQGNEKAIQVRAVRKLTKNNSFLNSYNEVMRDNKLFGKFKPNARSGRLTSDNENLQQIPRSLKSIFDLPKDGDQVFVYADFSQLELRAICSVCAERNMEKLYRDGADIHTYTAELLFGKTEDAKQAKIWRQIAKTANFALLYGAGIAVFKSMLLKDAGLWLSDEEAMKIKQRWLNLWPSIAAWQKEGIRAWKAGRAWETPLGRKYLAGMLTDQLNIQVQGFGAEVAKLALHYMFTNEKFKTIENDVYLANFIHDAYFWVAKNDPAVYTILADIIADSMQEAWTEMSRLVKITDLPMPVDVQVGFNWATIETDTIYETKRL
jgi:DNA polymerase I-like protein with 3'-5' exonuclease and polymerase domains